MLTRPDSISPGRLRKPSYTGENRCIPCTAVNLVLAAAITAVVAVAWVPAAVGVLLASLLSIYYRGYLVPGTPALTQRYLPERVLSWFGKEQVERVERGRDEAGPSTTLGAEATLLEADALERVDDGSGYRLAPAFRTAWLDGLDAAESVDVEDGARALFGDEATTTAVGDDLATVVDGSRLIGWESRAALRADVTAAEVLRERWDGWSERSGADRQELLSTLRAYLDRCPDCGSAVGLTETERESCCRPLQRTLTAECVDCGAVVLDVTETV